MKNLAKLLCALMISTIFCISCNFNKTEVVGSLPREEGRSSVEVELVDNIKQPTANDSNQITENVKVGDTLKVLVYSTGYGSGQIMDDIYETSYIVGQPINLTLKKGYHEKMYFKVYSKNTPYGNGNIVDYKNGWNSECTYKGMFNGITIPSMVSVIKLPKITIKRSNDKPSIRKQAAQVETFGEKQAAGPNGDLATIDTKVTMEKSSSELNSNSEKGNDDIDLTDSDSDPSCTETLPTKQSEYIFNKNNTNRDTIASVRTKALRDDREGVGWDDNVNLCDSS